MELELIEKEISVIRLTITPSRFVLKYNPKKHSKLEIDLAIEYAKKERLDYDLAKYTKSVRAEIKNGKIKWKRECYPFYKVG